MKARVIVTVEGKIKAFRLKKADYDPQLHGDIFPQGSDKAHDVEIPAEHEHIFVNEPSKVPGTFRIDVSGGKPASLIKLAARGDPNPGDQGRPFEDPPTGRHKTSPNEPRVPHDVHKSGDEPFKPEPETSGHRKAVPTRERHSRWSEVQEMALFFNNGYTEVISVAIMYYAPDECPDCPEGNNWMARGWWNIDPGGQKCPYGGGLHERNRYWCYYAQSADGLVWAGQYEAQVSDEEFHICRCLGVTGWRTVGFRLKDIGDNENYTITLVK
jgi:uncharacterized membrane protein